jgi:DNA-directed RNA polymerase specialized sigma24 family protein
LRAPSAALFSKHHGVLHPLIGAGKILQFPRYFLPCGNRLNLEQKVLSFSKTSTTTSIVVLEGRGETVGSRQNLKLEKVTDHESIFLDHYAWLLGRALDLTRGSKNEADDLVQDLYVRFVFSKSDIDVTDNERLKGYLFRALQNLSTDKHRSRERDPLSSLQTVDYDSMETALAAVDRSRLLYIRSDLAGICEYACFRRKSSRVGSVLILRFFLGYFPSEIATLLKSTPIAVHKLVETARLEAKAFLRRPGSLHLPGQDSIVRASFTKLCLPDDPTTLFARLHGRVFEEKEGGCLASDEFDLIYSDGSKRELTTLEIAHLVSCRACLERANHLLHFPDLSQRFPDDTNERNSSNPPSSCGAGKRTVEKMRRKIRATHEHRPNTLEIAVDGHVKGAQRVTSALSRFQILLKRSSNPRYITVLSEQGYDLLYLDLQDQEFPGLTPLRAEIALSDERSLVLELNPSGSASVIDLTYYDPALEIDDESWVLGEERHPIIQAEPEHISRPLARPWLPQRFWRTLSGWLSGTGNRLPISVGAAIGLAALFAVSLPWITQQKKGSQGLPTATALLAQSERAAHVAIPAGGASRRTFAIEVRNGSGNLIESATVQTLHGTLPERNASRLIGSNHKLLAGHWTDSAGKFATYTPKTGLKRPSPALSSAVTLDEAWSQVPDAAAFDRMAEKPDNIRVHPQKNGYELVYNETANAPSVSPVYADLVLSGNDLHATSETLRLKEGKVTREYRFRELTYEVLRPNQVTEGDFEPDASLRDLPAPGSITPVGAGSSAHLTLAALQLLSNLGPEVERIVNLERLNDGTVELNGVFPTSEQKASFAAVFRSLDGGAHLKLDLHASTEAMPSAKVPKPMQVESLDAIAVDTQRIPFDSEIRPVLAQQGLAGEQLDQGVRQISSAILTHSAQLHREGWSVSQIAAHDFSLEELQSMKPEDQMLWLTLLEKHIRSFDEQLAGIRMELLPIWREEKARFPGSPVALPSLHDAGELKEAAIILNHDSERLDRLLTAGFTLSPSLPANYNFADVGQLMSDLDTEEKTLQGTIERLHAFRQTEAGK